MHGVRVVLITTIKRNNLFYYNATQFTLITYSFTAVLRSGLSVKNSSRCDGVVAVEAYFAAGNDERSPVTVKIVLSYEAMRLLAGCDARDDVIGACTNKTLNIIRKISPYDSKNHKPAPLLILSDLAVLIQILHQ